ncbi:iron-containing alcohol dehydrogenase [Solidesulfovibrio fructosivorans JJ]]|uniref:Iron-containing alcohol dehydrogenase n=1 Tax=Solidesulfovibrio fructosivorans JJ] TaxID=596151 RepID=E1JRH0_SOLFR|nr:alcohol dehydrogenase-like regulatory protein ErcA [Solidesulfovibrio fructosivorans]EFL53171.1 iron-containing alcohol dehydrogenase [Solidesulfovibrio fructosivorans JJ]]
MRDDILLAMRKFVAPEFVFGNGALALAGRQAAGLGVRHALLVADSGLMDFGWPQRVQESLDAAGVETTLFTDFSSNPRDHESMAGSRIFGDAGCDALVAVGGGSAMDCAKAIGIVSVNQRHIREFEGVDNVERPGPPLLCVPTTAGTGAEVSQFAIITDSERRVKIAIAGKTLIPDAALIDPETTVTMSETLTAHTGLDALTHAMEAYVSNANSPMTDLLAREAIRLIAAHLLPAMRNPKDMQARGGMLLASLYAGMAFSNAILGAVHAMSHSLGGLLDLPHGLCNAILLDHVADYNFSAAPERYADIGRLLGARFADDAGPDEKKDAVLAAMRDFKRAAGVTIGLADLGVGPEALTRLAHNALDDLCLLTNPRQPSQADIEAIYEDARQTNG